MAKIWNRFPLSLTELQRYSEELKAPWNYREAFGRLATPTDA